MIGLAVLSMFLLVSPLPPDFSSGNPPIDVLHYHLSLELFEGERTLTGSAGIRFAVTDESLDSLILDLVGFTVDSVTMEDEALTFSRDSETVTVYLPVTLEAGDMASVTVAYSGMPGGNPSRGLDAGFYWDMLFLDNPVYMFYAMEPASCRYIFPCRDVIDDKAAFTTEVTVTDSLMAVAPGMLVETDRAFGRITYRWEMDREMPLYTWGLVVSDFVVIEDDRYSWIKYYRFENYSKYVDRAFLNVDLMMDCFQELYGRYPWDHELNFPCTPGFLFGEHNTMPYACIPMEEYVSHEISHMWWGNMITERDWSEIWIAEGMATYSEALWQEWMYGEKYYRIHMDYVMHSYLESGETRPVVPAEDYLWDSTSYEKGASVMHMLRHVVGDRSFFLGLRTFLQENAYGSVSTEDLRQTFEDVSGMELDWFFRQWIYESGIPMYRMSWTCAPEGDAWLVSLDIRQLQKRGPVFSMPVDILVHGDDRDSLFVIRNGTRVDSAFLMTDFRPLNVELDPHGWILRSGMFRETDKRRSDLSE